MKKFLIISFLAVMSVTAVAATYPASYYTIAPETTTLVGDVNGDGLVSSVDVTALYNYLLNGDSSSIVNGDQDGDGIITAVDITIIYNEMLNGPGSSGKTRISMNDYMDFSAGATPVQHVWKNTEDVIFIALDGVDENMYVLVRSGGKWILKDINASNKAGFKSYGSIKAAWVRCANYANADVNNIDVPYDLATGSGFYTCSNKTVAITLDLTLKESQLLVFGPTQGDYVTNYVHINGIGSIVDEDFYSEVKTPVEHIMTSGNTTYGYAYGIMQSYDYYHYLTASQTGYKSTMTYPLKPGRSHFIYSPQDYPSIWTREFAMCYNDAYDNGRQILQNSGSVITLPVGADISFFPQEAGMTVWDGILQSQSNTNPTSVHSFKYNTANTITIRGMEVGTASVSFTYTSPGGGTFTYNFTVNVVPSIWLAGSVLNASGTKVPSIYFNKRSTSHPTISGVTGNQWIERFEVGKGNGFAWVTNGTTSEIHRSTNPSYGGSYSKRYDVGASYSDAWLYADKSGNVYYLNKNNGYFTIWRNNGMVFDTNSNSVYAPYVKADYTNQKVALTYNQGSDEYFVQDAVAGTITSHDHGYYLPATDPNQTYGGRVSFWYENFAVDHGLAVVKKLKDVGVIENYEVHHTYTKWVDCYLSGALSNSVNYYYNTIPASNESEIYLTNDNRIIYLEDLATAKIAEVHSGSGGTWAHVTGLSDVVMCRYKDGYIYGVRRQAGLYYFFYGTLDNVCSGIYTQHVLNLLPQSFELKDIYLETTRN